MSEYKFFEGRKRKKKDVANSEDIRSGFNNKSKNEDAMDRAEEIQDAASERKPQSYKERVAARLSRLSPEERAERQKKIDAQRAGHEDGGVVKKKKGYFDKIKSVCKK